MLTTITNHKNHFSLFYVSLLVVFLSIIIFPFFTVSAESYGRSGSFTTFETDSSYHTNSVTHSNLLRYGNVRSNTGNVSSSRSGNTLNFSMSGGSPSSYSTRTESDYIESSNSYSIPSSITYNSNGYSGTLYSQGISTRSEPYTYYTYIDHPAVLGTRTVTETYISGYWEWCRNDTNTAAHRVPCEYSHNNPNVWVNYNDPIYSTRQVQETYTIKEAWREEVRNTGYNTYYYSYYSGTVSKPFYKYTVNYDWIDNVPPTVSSISSLNSYYSATNTANTLNISGYSNDADSVYAADTVKVYYTMKNSSGTPVSGHNKVLISSYVTNGSSRSFSQSIRLPSSLPHGSYSLSIWAEDDEGAVSATTTRSFFNDIVAPTNATLNFDGGTTTWSPPPINFWLNGTTDANSGIGKIEYRYGASDSWKTYGSLGSKITIPSHLSGNVTVDARVYDVMGNLSGISSRTIKINALPTLTLNSINSYYSSATSKNTVPISGTVNDADAIVQDTVSVEYTLKNSSGTPVIGHDGVNILTYTTNGAARNYSKNITLPSSLPDGNYTISVIATDNKGGTSPVRTVSFYNDTTEPATPVVNVDKGATTWTIPPVQYWFNGTSDSRSGLSSIEYRINGGSWQSYGLTQNLRITLPSSYAGIIRFEVRATDAMGNVSSIGTGKTMIDNIPPKIDSAIIRPNGDNQYMYVTAHDDESGIAGYKYSYKVIGKHTSFQTLADWSTTTSESSNKVLPKTPTNTRVEVYATVRDANDNTTSTRTLAYVTAPQIAYAGIEPVGKENTATIKFVDALGPGVKLEVYREGEFVALLESGDTFKDPGLDYERTYHYDFIAVSTHNGEEIRSLPLSDNATAVIKVGKPSLEFTVDKDIFYKTTFSDEITVSGTSLFRKGGMTTVDIVKKGTTDVLTSQRFNLTPYVSTPWKVTYEQASDETLTYVASGDLEDLKNTGMYKKTVEFKTGKKNVSIEPLRAVISTAIYK